MTFAINMNSIELENIITHKHTKFDFTDGVSIINGENGAGKCLTGNHYLNTNDGFLRFDELDFKNGENDINGIVTSLNKSCQFIKSFRHTENTYRIKTKRGIEIEGTKDHPLLCVNESLDYVWKAIKDIKVGDFIVGKSEKSPVIFGNKELDNDKCLLLGYFLANGKNNKISSGDSFVRNNIESILKRSKIPYTITSEEIRLQFHCWYTHNWLYNYGYRSGSANKEIAKIIRQGTKENIYNVLKGYFECDSSGSKRGTIEISSASKNLIDFIFYYLDLVYNIRGIKNSFYKSALNSKKPKLKEYYKITYCNVNAYKFSQVFPTAKCSRYYNTYFTKNYSMNNRIEVIPFLKSYITKEYVKCNVDKSGRGYFYSKDKKSVLNLPYSRFDSFEHLSHYSYFNNNFENWLETICKGWNITLYNKIKSYLSNTIYFEEVIENVNTNTEKEVFDINVPVEHQFLVNNIVSHNSMIFNTIANVIYATPPLSKKKNNAKSLFRKNGKITLNITKSDHNYTFEQFLKGDSVKYNVYQDGKDLEAHTIAEATDKIASIFPLSEEQFFTTFYINSYRSASHTLLYGTGVERKQFFLNFFDLDHYDYILSQLKNQYASLKDDKNNYESKNNQIISLTSQLVDIDLDRITFLEKEESKYNSLLTKWTEYQALYNQYKTIEQTLTELDESVLNTKLDKLKSKIKTLQEKLKQAEDIERNNKLYDSYITKKEKLESQIIPNLETSDYYKNKMDYLLQEKDKLNDKKQKLQNQIDDYEDWQDADSKISKRFKTTKEQALDDYANIIKRISIDDQIIENGNKLKDKSVCPTCGTKIDKEQWEVMISHAQEELNKLEKYKGQDKYFDTYFNPIKKPSLSMEDIQTEYNQLKADYKAQQDLYDKAIDCENAKKQLKELVVYEYQTPMDKDEIESELELKESKLEKIKDNISGLKQLKTIKIDLTKKDECDEWLKNNSEIVVQISQELGSLKTSVSHNKKLNDSIDALKRDLEVLENKLKDIEIYDALIKAYSTKGIRVQQIENVANLFCNQLNTYANLIFTEPVKFSVNVDENNFNIYAERDNGIGDVNTLSGAQSRAFQLLCVLVLTSFIPSKFRIDTIIMDEIEAGMSQKFRDKLCNEFIPQLKTLIPKIVMITPLDEKQLWIADAKRYKVIKQNNESKIVEV